MHLKFKVAVACFLLGVSIVYLFLPAKVEVLQKCADEGRLMTQTYFVVKKDSNLIKLQEIFFKKTPNSVKVFHNTAYAKIKIGDLQYEIEIVKNHSVKITANQVLGPVLDFKRSLNDNDMDGDVDSFGIYDYRGVELTEMLNMSSAERDRQQGFYITDLTAIYRYYQITTSSD